MTVAVCDRNYFVVLKRLFLQIGAIMAEVTQAISYSTFVGFFIFLEASKISIPTIEPALS